jgi:hypothetical protein
MKFIALDMHSPAWTLFFYILKFASAIYLLYVMLAEVYELG